MSKEKDELVTPPLSEAISNGKVESHNEQQLEFSLGDNKSTKPQNSKSKNYSKNSTSKPKNKGNEVGELLEFRAKRLLFHMGYYPRSNIIVKTSLDDESETITDLDVYGVYVHKDFRSKKVWVDCKAGMARPHERISWIKGVRQFVDVDDILFIKSNIRSPIKNFARKNNIQILELHQLEKLEQDYKIKANNWMGSWNPSTISGKLKEFTSISIPNNTQYKKIGTFISIEYWSYDIYTRLKKSMAALREVASLPFEAMKPNELMASKWAVYEVTILFALSVLSICEELYYLDDRERTSALYEEVVNGGIDAKKRNELVNASFRAAFEITKSKYPDFVIPNITDLAKNNPPSYFQPLNDLLSRIVHNPLDYYDVLRPLDFVLMENELLDRRINLSLLNEMFTNIEGNFRGMKTIITFVTQVLGVPSNMYIQFNTTKSSI
ncbi:hypothetical protein [Paenibacillus sp. sgz500992]|uniref:hypothetical protein n=1 Tax=Paenibacillus sp. sgz500992 TaxID=3242476 RepID=UPI0036D21703